MPPLPNRKTLESMKRVDLQRICKDYGVRANLKSEALIDLLLDTQSTPAPQPTRRSVSTRQVSRAGPSRVSSMIVHDIEEEKEEQNDNDTHSEGVNEDIPPTPRPLLIPPPRTRKAKELQTRLGVGKPLAAGGQGPRAVTRSSGSSKSRGMKSSRSLKPKEATIEEEPETLSLSSKPAIEPEVQPAPSLPQRPQDPSITDNCDSESLTIKKLISDAMRPLQDQIQSLKSKLDEVQTIRADLAALRNQVTEISKTQKEHANEFKSLRELSVVVTSLREEMNQLKDGLANSQSLIQPSTPKVRSSQLQQAPIGYGHLSTIRPRQGTSTNTNNPPVNPGIAESTLGKRQRDSIASDIAGVVEGQEEGHSDSETTSKVVRPIKKKPRLEKSNSGQSSRQASTNPADEDKGEDAAANDDMHRFTVFRGSDEPSDYVDPPPPTNTLPSFFEPPAGSSTNLPRTRQGVPTSSANASENQPQTFGFSFLPISSTPQNAMYTQMFSYPEPPQSPSPAGSSLATFPSRNDDQRNDIFKPFGFPSPIRSARNYGALTQDDRGVNPAALAQGSSTKQRELSTNDARAVSSTDSTTSTAEPPVSKRTMYGTELEGDTRFGDFGLEGMATDYWANGNF